MKNFFFIAFTITIISCGNKNSVENNILGPVDENIVELTEAQQKQIKLDTGKIEQKNISSLLKVNGSIDVPPQNMVSISAPLGGYLKSTSLLPGMHIRKGETIAIMEDQQYIQLQQDYLIAKTNLITIEKEYERQKELNVSKAISDKIFEKSAADFTSQKIMVKSLSEKLRLIGIQAENLTEQNLSRAIPISAPIDGYVSSANVNIGKYLNPSDVLFEIVNPSDIHLALNIFEKDINSLSIGQQVLAYTNNDPQKKYVCEIILIGKNFSSDRHVSVHCHFKNYDHSLIPGMFMNAEIEIQQRNTYVLPLSAVVNYDSKQYIFSVNNNYQYEMIEVNTGSIENELIEIIFSEPQNYLYRTYVTNGAYNLLMKMKNTEEE